MTTDTIKFKRGVKSKLNNLSYGEPAYISDEGELYIGTKSGVEKLTSNKEVKELSSQLAHIKYQRFNVMDYGAKGDGVTDDSEAIRRCIADLPESNFELIFPPGVYIQGDGTNPHYIPNSSGSYSGDVNMGKPICFDFVSKSNFKIVGYGAEIHSHPNNSCIANNRGFSFINCDNGLVEGIVYIGNIETRRPWGSDEANYNNQHGFKCEGSRYITFYKCKAIGCVMDGFYFGGNGRTYETYSNHIKMIDCVSLRNYRQGLSVVNGHYGVLENCLFAETGTIYGTSPKAGVDMEQGYENYEDRGQRGWVIKNCTFTKNEGSGLSLHWGTHEALVEGCKFIEDSLDCPSDSGYLTVNNTIKNCIFRNAEVSFNGGGILFEGNTCLNTNINLGDDNKTYEKGLSRKNTVINNILNWDFKLESENIDSNGIVAAKRRFTIQSPSTVFNNNILNNPTGTFILYCSGGNFDEFCNNVIRGTKELEGVNYLGTLENFLLSDLAIVSNNIVSKHYKVDRRIDRLSNSNVKTHLNYIENRYFREENLRIDFRICKSEYINNVANVQLSFDNNETVTISRQGNGNSLFSKSNINGSLNRIILSPIYEKNGYYYITIRPFSSTSTEEIATKVTVNYKHTYSSHDIDALKQVQTRGYEADLNEKLKFYKPLATGCIYTSKPLSSEYLINVGDMIIYNKVPYYYKGNDEWIGLNGSII